jgi:hypothetical protein
MHTDNHNYARTDPERRDIYISPFISTEKFTTLPISKKNPNRIER